jgi:hypothetical protein
MRAIIFINWLLSFCSLCIDTERSPLWASAACVAWFALSSYLLRFAEPRPKSRITIDEFFKGLENVQYTNPHTSNIK